MERQKKLQNIYFCVPVFYQNFLCMLIQDALQLFELQNFVCQAIFACDIIGDVYPVKVFDWKISERGIVFYRATNLYFGFICSISKVLLKYHDLSR